VTSTTFLGGCHEGQVIELAPDRVTILSEVDIADCFASQYCNELGYVAKWGQWLL
jgi:hypothetical protein